MSRDHEARAVVCAPPAAVTGALTTTVGLQGWWTDDVAGDPSAVGGTFVLGFASVGEQIELVVEDLDPAGRVTWRCEVHTGHPEWAGTRIAFSVEERGEGSSLRLVHHGLRPDLRCFDACEQGWTHFLGSLVAHVEGRPARPFRSTRPQRP